MANLTLLLRIGNKAFSLSKGMGDLSHEWHILTHFEDLKKMIMKVRTSFVKIPSVCSRVRGAGSYEAAGSPQAGVAESVVSA